jgi:hypothetical protein
MTDAPFDFGNRTARSRLSESVLRFQVALDIPGCSNNLETCYVVAHSGVNDYVSKLWCNLESAFTVSSSRRPALAELWGYPTISVSIEGLSASQYTAEASR